MAAVNVRVSDNPKIPANSNIPNCYKIKLRASGYRFIYPAVDGRLRNLAIALSKHEQQQAYDIAKARLEDSVKMVENDTHHL